MEATVNTTKQLQLTLFLLLSGGILLGTRCLTFPELLLDAGKSRARLFELGGHFGDPSVSLLNPFPE